jgi:hypothetical protein
VHGTGKPFQMDEAHKEQTGKVADKKVDVLLAGGLEAQLKKKRKRQEKKKFKQLLGKIFFTLP